MGKSYELNGATIKEENGKVVVIDREKIRIKDLKKSKEGSEIDSKDGMIV